MTLQRFFERLIWLCILPLLILGAILSFVHLDALGDRRQILSDSVLRGAVRLIDQTIEIRLTNLTLLGRMLETRAITPLGELNREHAYELAQQFVNLHGHHVLIADDWQQMLINTRFDLHTPLPPMPSAMGRSALAISLATNTTAVGDAFIGPISQHELVALAVPLNTSSRHRLVVMTMVEIAQLERLLGNLSLPSEWLLQVLDSEGKPFMRSGPDENTPQVIDDKTPGNDYRASMSQAPWTVVLHAPPISPVDSRSAQAAMLLTTLVATVAVAYWGGRLASRRLSRSMASLVRPVADPPANEDIDDVRSVRDTLRRFTRERQQMQEAERRRIALEVHDDLQQRLILLRHEIEDFAAHGLHGPPPEARAGTGPPANKGTAAALALLDETLESTRRLVQDMRPQALEDLGLPEALRGLVARYRKAGQLALQVDLQVLSEARSSALDPEVATALYRIAQEALNNVVKHAQAESAYIVLDARSPLEVVMEIIDDGVGFDSQTPERRAGDGLHGMHERAWALGGRLEVQSAPGQGTALTVHIPLPFPTLLSQAANSGLISF